ncbi:MAG: endolytic transglycosylase MltG [Bacteroidota bacterium]
MSFVRFFLVTKSDVLIATIVLLISFSLVYGSRVIRYSTEYAVIFYEPTELILTEKTALDDLINLLKEKDTDFKEEEFYWVSRMEGWRYFTRGRYLLEGAYSYEIILSKLARGIQDPKSVVVLPGQTEERLIANLANEFWFEENELRELLSDSVWLSQYGIEMNQVSGRLFPDTYLMYWTSTPQTVIQRMLTEYEKSVLSPYQSVMDSLELTADEINTMASIIEWEYKYEEEKTTISGLYWNRLKRGMPLQADPTVNYAVGERRRLLFEDYQFEHPYNTYLNAGLPPGPITNPSLSSIKAALFPENHRYLYMVANPEGGHVFTRTFEEHKIESEKWRRWLQKQYRIKRQRESDSLDASSNL